MEQPETIIGVDFAGPRQALQQRRKIIGIAAIRNGPRSYRVAPDGFNARLIQTPSLPGWTAEELAATLLGSSPARVVALDFPFSIPQVLLNDPSFAAAVGCDEAFGSWTEFNRLVSSKLPLQPPNDLTPFAAWRNKAYWLKRATDVPARAQPALKDRFQVLFNMTLLGNALLAPLAASGSYLIIPFHDTGPDNQVIEIYPGVTMRTLNRPDYKRDPAGAIEAIIAHCAAKGITIDVDPAVRSFCANYRTGRGATADPDGSDALIALATAVLYREGLCEESLGAEHRHQRLVEGVIWKPAM